MTPEVITLIVQTGGPWLLGIVTVMMLLQFGGLGIFAWVVHRELVLLRMSIDAINDRLLTLLAGALGRSESLIDDAISGAHEIPIGHPRRKG